MSRSPARNAVRILLATRIQFRRSSPSSSRNVRTDSSMPTQRISDCPSSHKFLPITSTTYIASVTRYCRGRIDLREPRRVQSDYTFHLRTITALRCVSFHCFQLLRLFRCYLPNFPRAMMSKDGEGVNVDGMSELHEYNYVLPLSEIQNLLCPICRGPFTDPGDDKGLRPYILPSLFGARPRRTVLLSSRSASTVIG